MRINRYISEKGGCSRREADKLIAEGRVKIAGRTAVLGDIVMQGQKVTLDGRALGAPPKKVYLAFNKPIGITCTTDLRVKDNIISYIGYPERIFPIGRLDKDSEGLILLTNDGDVVNRVLRAEYEHQKEYLVTLNQPVSDAQLRKLVDGVEIFNPEKNEYVLVKAKKAERITSENDAYKAKDEDGRGAGRRKGENDDRDKVPEKIRDVRKDIEHNAREDDGREVQNRTGRGKTPAGGHEAKIVLTQGLNRQVRRMFEAVGLKVVNLKRIRIMHIKLGKLKTGYYRELSKAEIAGLWGRKTPAETEERNGKDFPQK